MRLASLSLVLCLCAACADDPREPADPGVLGDAVKTALGDLAHVPRPADGLEYNLFELEGTELTGDVTASSCDACWRGNSELSMSSSIAISIGFTDSRCCGSTTTRMRKTSCSRPWCAPSKSSATSEGKQHCLPGFVGYAGTP